MKYFPHLKYACLVFAIGMAIPMVLIIAGQIFGGIGVIISSLFLVFGFMFFVMAKYGDGEDRI